MTVAFNPSGDRIVSGSTDNDIKLWDAKSYTLIQTLNTNKYTDNKSNLMYPFILN